MTDENYKSCKKVKEELERERQFAVCSNWEEIAFFWVTGIKGDRMLCDYLSSSKAYSLASRTEPHMAGHLLSWVTLRGHKASLASVKDRPESYIDPAWHRK